MAMMIEQRAQLFQTLGSIAASAADAAAEGMAEAAKADSQIVDTALKLFGGFDRNEFENIDGQAPNLLLPAIRPPASYEGPAEYFKPLSNVADQGFLVQSKDLLQQLQDPRFRLADGLSGFSDNRLTQILLQNNLSMNTTGDVSLGGQDQNAAASFDAFGKLYMMENTVGKQLQLYERVDLGAFGYISGAKQNPRMDRGLKGMPDAQAAAPQSKEILNLLEHALNAVPKTVGEMVQMLDVLLAKVQEIMEGPHSPFMSDALHKELCLAMQQNLSNLKNVCQNLPANLKPSPVLLEYLQGARQGIQRFLPNG